MRVFNHSSDSVRIHVELLAQLPVGAGARTIQSGVENQKRQANYLEEFNEGSSLRVPPDSEGTAVYSFSVQNWLVYHWHDGPRAITAITNSDGLTCRFGLHDVRDLKNQPTIARNVVSIEIPPDTLFHMAFSGYVPHQFGNPHAGCSMYGVSVHPNEFSGLEGGDQQAVIHSGHGEYTVADQNT